MKDGREVGGDLAASITELTVSRNGRGQGAVKYAKRRAGAGGTRPPGRGRAYAKIVDVRDLQTSPLAEALRRRLLTLVLLTVLAWYTVVVPPAPFVRHAGPPRDAEERDEDGNLPARLPAANNLIEDLDWPEFIEG